ncbi:type II CAAX prenyl endopeptidase Rce1 family protein [Peribacillus acanthi]|uniref:CPBP family glutamic-type intramembrane protease n=1 Tax=Peribacillus acanthi TaxID=2171554 RepID=UPI000D3EBB5C|nr:CPBP family glutamic-type intramembrane protease [Peribacillus acanthi]
MQTNLQLNTVEHPVQKSRVLFALVSRTLFFLLTGGLIVVALIVSGSEKPLEDYIKWWTLQAILANIATFFFLRHSLKKEGLTYKQLINDQNRPWKQEFKTAGWLLIVGIICGYAGTVGGGFLVFGEAPPETMFEGLPLWAALVFLLIFPLSVAMTELPTYFAYSMNRLEQLGKGKWSVILWAAFWLAFQHVALPLVLDWEFFLWRFVAFVPLAIVIAIFYYKTRRLRPLMMVHFIIDLQVSVMILLSAWK